MPRSARLLRFPSQPAVAVYSAAESKAFAEDFLSVPLSARTGETWKDLANADVTLAVLDALKALTNSAPGRVNQESAALYEFLKSNASVGVFDERDYFLGEAALLAGNTGRLVGQFESAENWLDLADFAFRHTINSPPLLTRVSHARLVLRYEMRRYSQVLALLPSVKAEYERLGMRAELNKARFLEGLTLKETGKSDDSLACLLALRESFGTEEPTFRSLVLTNLAEEYARRDETDKALAIYEEAFEAASASCDRMASAQLKTSIGEVYRVKGEYGQAIDCVRSAISGYASLGMQSRVAYLRVVLAESLLAANREREAEWEILAALPTIQEQQMVVEGVAAVELLKISVHQKKTDRSALSNLRHLLQNS